MRKNLLASVVNPQASSADSQTRSEYARRGASRSMMISIDEMAENARKMIDGETVVSLDAGLLDASFVVDRIADDDEEYLQLREAIKDHGQSTPILVRPHPEQAGRYMIVFGHRRARVAKGLGVPVRAVVKNLEQIAHIIAQGQENTARANLSFIEKALFAKKLRDMGQTKETIKSSLTIDDTLLSRMLAVAETVPAVIVDGIGAAKTVGRDRWEELKKLLLQPKATDLAKVIGASPDFLSKISAERFNYLVERLKTELKPARKTSRRIIDASSWTPDDGSIAAKIKMSGTQFTLALKAKGTDAKAFGNFLTENLTRLYDDFRRDKRPTKSGD